MDEQFPVFRLTQDAYNQLLLVASESPDIYLNPEADFHAILTERGFSDYTEETGIFSSLPISLTPASDGLPNRADTQALDFYNSLHGVTPRVATDSLMWAWMTHFRFHAYGLQRWRRQSNTNLTNYIRNHWFVRDESESLWNGNTASRLWWLADMAYRAAKFSGGTVEIKDAVEHFANHAEHYHILRRRSLTRSPLILAEIVRALLNEAEGIKDDGVAELWSRINLNAGTRLLDVMPRELLRSQIVGYVDEIMSDPELVADRTKLRNRKPMVVLSLGAGVQSSVLALMADRGEYGLPRPDIAIFADTGWEPQAVYDHLDWLDSKLSFDVVRVSAGNIREDILKGVNPSGRKFLEIPAFLVNPDGSHSIAARQCTAEYKLYPIHRELRKRLEIPSGRRAPKETYVEMWLGISADERLRQKPSREEWITNRFPLIEQEFSRAQLLNWFNENYPERSLPRSSCIGCPYRGDAEWKQLQKSDPKSFQDAVFIDQALRNVPATRDAIKGDAYLHKSRKPLAEVDFSDVTSYDNQMLEECEGLCGI